MGDEERKYGRLGETVHEKKKVLTATGPSPKDYDTFFKFDTFGRLLRITYPDGEIVTNVYDSGGNLQSASGVKRVDTQGQNHRYHYLHKLHYDKFEQRAFVEQGNGVKTVYTYDAPTRRLSNLNAVRQANVIFQNLTYSYDKVGNVLGLKNDVERPTANTFGGPSLQRFEYDELYRLTKAQGVFQSHPNATVADQSACNGSGNSHCRVYSLDMAYDTIHNILSKNQLDTRFPPGGSGVTQKKTSYNFGYTYGVSGPSSVRPHAPTRIADRTYSYDLNGNQTGWEHVQNGTRRNIVWDDENRIQSLFDNGHEKTYRYDDQGNRVIKRGPQGETVYVNQFFTDRPGATGTKHVYAGTSRIASKMLRQDTQGANPAGKTPFEKDIYFYHPDHLGSSSYITDLNGKLYEALVYFPFGEGWIEENTNVQRTPFHFTSKELDEETGLYYFGARYYDPRTSVWQSADPALGKFVPRAGTEPSGLPGFGGIYNSLNLGLYTYGHQNPIKYVDPDGRFVWFIAAGVAAGALIVIASSHKPTPMPGKKPDSPGGLSDGSTSKPAGPRLPTWSRSESNEGDKNEGKKEERKKEGAGDEAKAGGSEIKIDDKIKDQLGGRGWTEGEVRELGNTEPIGTSTDNTKGKNDPASVYGSKDRGHVVINDRTKEVVQVSDKNDPDWKPDRRIKWNDSD